MSEREQARIALMMYAAWPHSLKGERMNQVGITDPVLDKLKELGKVSRFEVEPLLLARYGRPPGPVDWWLRCNEFKPEAILGEFSDDPPDAGRG